MGKTLILMFHPEWEKSHANRALAEAAAGVDGPEVVNMAELYPDLRAIDVDREVERLYTADRLVLQFPIHWYAAPPLLMQWQNTVITRMFYVHPKEEGERLRGLPFAVAATAGNVPEAYTAQGANGFPLGELLHPLAATAKRCAFAWREPFLLYRANRLDDGERHAAGERYAAWLGEWTDVVPARAS